MLKSDTAVSLGMLRNVGRWPAKEMPEWANTFAKRAMDMGITNVRLINTTIEQMEIARRKRVREKLGITQITEFDAHLADLFSRFNIKTE